MSYYEPWMIRHMRELLELLRDLGTANVLITTALGTIISLLLSILVLLAIRL